MELINLYQYHSWRVNAWANHLRSLEPNYLGRPIEGSFPTLQALLAHMVGSEYLWLSRLESNNALTAFPAIPSQDFGSIATAWLTVASRWLSFVQNQPAEKLQQEVHYTNTRREAYTNRMADVLTHVVDHCTYHSGQLVSALRELGLPVVSTNMIFYFRR